jgi:hypothetical protein
VFGTFSVNFELRDHYGDVGHHLLVQDAPSFMQKYMSSIHFRAFVVFVYILKSVNFSLISMRWPFLGLLVPTMTSASKNLDRQPRFRVHLSHVYAIHIWSTFLFLDKRQFLPPGISWNKRKKTERVECEFLDKRCLEIIPSCSSSSNKLYLVLVLSCTSY